MTRNPKRIPITISNPLPGARSVTSLAHARRYVNRGEARFTAGGFLEFIHRRASSNGPILELSAWVDYETHDSGFSTAPYPMASQNTGPKYPGLAKDGAGLC